MPRAMSPEGLNPSTGPGRTEMDIEDNRPTASEDQMDSFIQNRTPAVWQKWIHYIISWMMLFSGFAVIIAGMTSRHEGGWGLAFIA